MSEQADILYEQRGAVVVVTLNRPRALNALTLEMCRQLDAWLAAWAADPEVSAVVVKGAGPRAFCAGGDVRAIWEGVRDGSELPAAFFAAEYRMNRRVFHFPKAYIALIDGVTMGGGVGVSAHGSHRVATERTLLAMPETGIGLFPDVGASYLLPRLPGRLGRYLGLTGARLKAADCLYAEIATHRVGSSDLPALEDALVEADWSGDATEVAAAAIERFSSDPGEPPLAAYRRAIDRCFAGASVEAIFDNLAAEGGDWADDTLAGLKRCSPTSLKITFRAIEEGARLDFDSVMSMEYRLSQACMAGHDFSEGVRAVVIDKDNAPAWRPASLAAVTDDAVEAHFAPQGAPELAFD
jgi:enoyl-CoA hydratase